MTNEEWIKSLPRKELAKRLISTSMEPDWGDDDDGWNGPFMQTIYTTSDSQSFYEDYEGAIEHECWWLAQERSE